MYHGVQFTIHIDDLVQDCSISIANVLEILQSCTKPSTFAHSLRPFCYSICHLNLKGPIYYELIYFLNVHSVVVFITYIYVVQLSVCFYTLLMSIQLRRYFAANIMGVVFTIPW